MKHFKIVFRYILEYKLCGKDNNKPSKTQALSRFDTTTLTIFQPKCNFCDNLLNVFLNKTNIQNISPFESSRIESKQGQRINNILKRGEKILLSSFSPRNVAIVSYVQAVILHQHRPCLK